VWPRLDMADPSAQRDAADRILQITLSGISPEEVHLIKFARDPRLPSESISGPLGFGAEVAGGLFLSHLLPILLKIAEGPMDKLAEAWGKEFADFLIAKHPGKNEPGTFQKFEANVMTRLEENGFSHVDSVRASQALLTSLLENPELVRRLIGR
jgi:hypothetical protein